MANISDANGTIEVSADSKEAIEALRRVIYSLETGCDYLTNFDKNPNIYQKGELWHMVGGFAGSGRWCYQNNIQSVFDWAIISDEDRQLLTKTKFNITFDYEDYEPGCEVFGHGVDTLMHKANAPLEKTSYYPQEWTDFDLSWGNRLEHGFEQEEYLLSYLEEMDDDEVYEFLEQEKEGLEEHFKQSLQELLDARLESVKDAYERGAANGNC